MFCVGALRRRISGWVRLLLYPVSRKLAVCVLAYMAGIVTALKIPLKTTTAGMLCVFLLFCLELRRRKRKGLLPAVCALAILTGNCAAGAQLQKIDEPTLPRTPISGTVARVESDYRVMLTDVCFGDGGTTNRPIVVTLMQEEEQEPPAPPLPGQRVSGIGRLFAQEGVRNPGGTDRRMRALCDGYELSGYVLPGWTVEGEARFSVSEAFRRLRLRLSAQLDAVFGENAPFFAAILLGERDAIDPTVSSAMRLTGTAHILSVSGMHLSMVAAGIYALLKRLPVGRKTAAAIQLTCMVGFAALTGFAVGTVRALVMAMMRMLARLRGRQYDALTSLAVAALCITLASPLMLFDAGFQYSFFVVFGILLLQKPIDQLAPMRRLRRRAEGLCDMVTISLSAQVAALPIQLALYGYVPLTALAMNLLVSMLMPLLMLSGWTLLCLSVMLMPAAQALGVLPGCIVHLYEQMTLFVSQLRGGVLRLPAPEKWMLALFGAAMALVSSQIRFGRLRRAALYTVLLMMLAGYAPRFQPATRYVQLDVGQGDASLIRAGRHAVVIDVGSAYSYDLLRYIRHEGLSIDALLLTHMDEDHAGALNVLCHSEVAIGRVIMAERATEDAHSEAVVEGLALLEVNGVPVEYVKAGDQVCAMGLCFDVLSPTDALCGSNERSLLLGVQVEGKRLLLTGDLPKTSEPEEVAACDLLKVAHHGSKNASSTDFLEKASPKLAIISVGGGNSYGHPHARVLRDLEELDAQIYRTDESGCITVWLKDEWKTETFLGYAAK